ncbi:hypothetical protein PFICI_01910 [Pestalotiopsis fici W106-1]|uniref:Zn(2)-C6 fungal-type domain-containing protein n=1 Tax=Pestalotiopsis fici (strain W106-1 / CGMCC3.15140) TaxID=1229662 RepID=W3XRE2_PESFW|nr:uncharacterized protein PFICI_01910 [Pestalotiopsis fici W106-1]ETS88082.1 hypothetical protein PFICI_01910 [Pestalotiopsis fici W106-1]
MDRPLAQNKRTRKGTAKSRRGCARCKSRRVKCDEKRPSCENCVRIGLQCPGSQKQPLRWSRKHEQSEEYTSVSNPPQDQVQADATSLRNNEGCSEIVAPLVNCLVASDAPLKDTECPEALEHCDVLGFVPDIWHTHDEFLNPRTDEDAGRPWDWSRDTPMTTKTFVLPDNQCNMLAASISRSLHGLTHLPTMLIEYWFCYICPIRSTFDSDINFNRILAKNAHARAEAVMYTMQAMSIACLLKDMPQLRETSLTLRSKAISAINCTLTQVRTANSIEGQIVTDLIFAVFCIGTSTSWLASSSMEDDPWLDIARELLCYWRRDPDTADTLVYAYFCQALTYWKMLLAAEGRGPTYMKVHRNQQQRRSRLRQAAQLMTNDSSPEVPYDEPACGPINVLLGSRPNSWCGISNEVIDIFGQVMALCRTTMCQKLKSPNPPSVTELSNKLCDLSIAHGLYRELNSMDFGALVLMDEVQGFPVHTQDDNTPIAHLVQTAEAYRLAGILQLKLAFPEIVSELSDHETIRNEKFQADNVVASALQLVSLLEQIPPESGSLSIHALLFLSVAAGLECPAKRQKTFTWNYTTREDPELFCDPNSMSMSGQANCPSVTEGAQVPRYLQDPRSGTVHYGYGFLPPLTWEICKARRFVRTRLAILQRKLPHRASSSLLQIVDTIWSEYDERFQRIHWLEALEQCGSGIILL